MQPGHSGSGKYMYKWIFELCDFAGFQYRGFGGVTRVQACFKGAERSNVSSGQEGELLGSSLQNPEDSRRGFSGKTA